MNSPLQKLVAERDRLVGEIDISIARIKAEQDRINHIDNIIRQYEDAIDKLYIPEGDGDVQRTV